MGSWVSRETFQNPDEVIKRLAPQANLDVYKSVIQSFEEDVVRYSPDTPTIQAVDAFLGQQGSLNAKEKADLKPILLEIFQIRPGPADEKEARQIKFKPDATALQPRMAARPIDEISVPDEYVTSDPDPVLPDSKKMSQQPTLNRGQTDTVAYTWNQAAYQQADVAGQYAGRGYAPATIPPTHVRESMSTMAGTTTITNEIYGPRVPKERGVPVAQQQTEKETTSNSEIFPSIYGPSTRPLPKQTDPGSITGQDTLPPNVFVLPSTSKTEPVPFLTDFSKFGK